MKNPKTKRRSKKPAIMTDNSTDIGSNSYKENLINSTKRESDYDAVFKEKLEAQYREFRALKEHRLQIKKYINALSVIGIIIIVALLLLIYNG